MMSACSTMTAVVDAGDDLRLAAARWPPSASVGVSISRVSTSEASGAMPLMRKVQPAGRPEYGSSFEKS